MTTSKDCLKKLDYYVYLLIDPDTKKVFYVGKGNGCRATNHDLQKEKNPKLLNYLGDLKKRGWEEPQIDILVHGLKEGSAAHKVEAAIIDLIGLDKLTNRVKGHGSRNFGRAKLTELVAFYSNKPLKINEKDKNPNPTEVLLVKIENTYKPGMTPQELYDATRYQWGPAKKKIKNIKYVACVYGQVVREIYEVREWFEAGATFMAGERMRERPKKNKSEFVGKIAKEEIRKKFLNKSVSHLFKPGAQGSFQYLAKRATR